MGVKGSINLFLVIVFDRIVCDKFLSRPYFGDAETEVTVQQGEAAFFQLSRLQSGQSNGFVDENL